MDPRLPDSPVQPGAGSAVFLHLESAPGESTPGCTSMPRPTLLEPPRWLDPALQPVPVQAVGAVL